MCASILVVLSTGLRTHLLNSKVPETRGVVYIINRNGLHVQTNTNFSISGTIYSKIKRCRLFTYHLIVVIS